MCDRPHAAGDRSPGYYHSGPANCDHPLQPFVERYLVLCGYSKRCSEVGVAEIPMGDATAGFATTDIIFFNVACSLLLLAVVIFEWKLAHHSTLLPSEKTGPTRSGLP